VELKNSATESDLAQMTDCVCHPEEP